MVRTIGDGHRFHTNEHVVAGCERGKKMIKVILPNRDFEFPEYIAKV